MVKQRFTHVRLQRINHPNFRGWAVQTSGDGNIWSGVYPPHETAESARRVACALTRALRREGYTLAPVVNVTRRALLYDLLENEIACTIDDFSDSGDAPEELEAAYLDSLRSIPFMVEYRKLALYAPNGPGGRASDAKEHYDAAVEALCRMPGVALDFDQADAVHNALQSIREFLEEDGAGDDDIDYVRNVQETLARVLHYEQVTT